MFFNLSLDVMLTLLLKIAYTTCNKLLFDPLSSCRKIGKYFKGICFVYSFHFPNSSSVYKPKSVELAQFS